MKSEQKKELKKLFNKKKKLAFAMQETGSKLDKLIEDIWGFHYSQKDIDAIIDCIDYGTVECSFDEFVNLMNDAIDKETTNS